MRILEEFWYGNIEPTEYDTSSCKEYKKLLELICRNEEKLQATMTDEQKHFPSKNIAAISRTSSVFPKLLLPYSIITYGFSLLTFVRYQRLLLISSIAIC